MIYYNSNTINDWNFGDDNIIKVYRNGAVVFYKFDGEQGGYKICYAVVEDISQYSETEFEDVYDKATEKWFKLNNLNQYEEYGIYGTGRNVTTYEGKLTIDDGYEYQYSGNSWVNVGEVSGSSRVPVGYTEVEYIENTSTAYINTGFKPNQNTKILITTQCVTSTSGGRHIGAGGYDKTNAIQFDYESGAQGTLHISWGTTAGWTTYSSCVGDYNKHTYEWDGNVFYRDKGEQNQFSATTAYGTYQCTDNLGIFTRYQNGSGGGSSECFRGKVFDFKMYDNGTLIRDLVPAKRDSDNKYGMYDIVNDVFYLSPNSVAFTGGSESTPMEYPIYYDDIQAPLDKLSFSSITEANTYAYNNCVYDGMRATINGDKYVFDSNDGWVYQPSRLPSGYTEVEYVENTSSSYIDTGFKPNQDTRITSTMQTVTSTSYGRMFGCGGYNKTNAIQVDYETGANGTLHISWGHIAGWTTYSNCKGDYNVHIYDWDKNYFYRDKGETNQFSASTTYTAFQCSINLSIFMAMQSSGPDTGQTIWKGKLFDFKVYDNGTLIRDLVPCTRDSDSVAGCYDVVNDVFYYPPNYASNPLTAGPQV